MSGKILTRNLVAPQSRGSNVARLVSPEKYFLSTFSEGVLKETNKMRKEGVVVELYNPRVVTR